VVNTEYGRDTARAFERSFHEVGSFLLKWTIGNPKNPLPEIPAMMKFEVGYDHESLLCIATQKQLH
jgi:hypothetical protein